MASSSLAARTAADRSRDADFGTDEAGELNTREGHRHAALLHQEAATWHRRAGTLSRAMLHDEQARIHDQLAKRIEPGTDGTQ